MAILEYFKEIPLSHRSIVVKEKVIFESETEKIQYTLLCEQPNFSPRDNLTKTTFTRVDSGCFVEVKSIVRDDIPEKEGVTRITVHNRGYIRPSPESPQDTIDYTCLSVNSMGGSVSI